MKEIEGTTEFLRRKSNLYKDEHGKTKMQIVVNGLYQGFRRHPIGTGNHTCLSRGDYESVSHQGNKEAIIKWRTCHMFTKSNGLYANRVGNTTQT